METQVKPRGTGGRFVKKTAVAQPVEDFTAAHLKKTIREKFGTVTKFCKLTNRDVYDFNRLMRLKESEETRAEIRKVYAQIEATENKPAGNVITDEMRCKIRGAIYSKYANVKDFCEKNTDYINTWVSNVLQGHIGKVTPKVKKLLKDLGIETETAQA